jgi:hypothetical protein
MCVMLLSVVMMSVMLNVVESVFMLSATMLSAIMLNVIVLISVELSVVISFRYYVWYQTECRYTEFCSSKFYYGDCYEL